MYAIVDIAGFQERVEEGKVVRVPLQEGNAGKALTFASVLMVVDGGTVTLGDPYVSGASVEGEVVSHGRGEKIRVVKAHRRKRYRRVKGHRQDYTEMKVKKIALA